MLESKPTYEELEAENAQLRGRVQALEAENAYLRRRITELEGQVSRLTQQVTEALRASKRQAAPFSKGMPKTHPKRPGRKKGHPGTSRRRPEQIDEMVWVPLTHCPHCGGSVQEVQMHTQMVEDIPPIRPKVTCYFTQSGFCPRCGCRVESRHPDQTGTAKGAAGVQMGPNVIALAADLKHRLGLSFRKICDLLDTHWGLAITPGGLVHAIRRLSKKAEPTVERIVEQARASPVIHSDETGWRIGGVGAWLWVFTNRLLTVFAIRRSRGHEVIEEILGEIFDGILVSDCFPAYDPIQAAGKGKCMAHLLRNLSDLETQQTRGAIRFPRKVADLFRRALWLKDQQDTLPTEKYATKVNHLEAELDRLLAGHYTNPDNLRMANRLRKHRDALFTFLKHPDVDPTNNLAERQLRPAVIVRKLSGGNRTEQGAHTHEILATLAVTVRQQGISFLEVARTLLTSERVNYVFPLFELQMTTQALVAR
jgi:hypothetical protein